MPDRLRVVVLNSVARLSGAELALLRTAPALLQHVAPSRSLDALTALAGAATTLRGTRGQAEEAAHALLELCRKG